MKDLTNFNWNELLSSKRKRTIPNNRTDISPFYVDYTKSIFSSSFRRLQHKTQVFPLERLDYVRSRLTHSLEVDAIVKNLIQYIFKDIKLTDRQKNTFPVLQHCMNILSAAALIHDIGNPPFGHHGEEAIRNWFNNSNIDFDTSSGYNDYKLFDGNAQGFRVITKLQIEGHEKPSNGLNFTAATIATLCKTTKLSNDNGAEKIACFLSEKEIFDWAFTSCGLKKRNQYIRHPLSFIMEAADDIANCASDLEDAIKKNVIPIERLLELIKEKLNYNHFMYRILTKGLTEGKNNSHPDPVSVAIKGVRYEIQRRMIKSISNTFIRNFDELLDGSEINSLINIADPDIIFLYNFLKKDIAERFVYQDKSILLKEISGDKIINELLNIFITASLSGDTDHKTLNGKLYCIISDNFKYIINDHNSEKERIQLVIDYITGMTDTFAYDLYQTLSSIN